jgi:zinc and cadmium transporter
VSDAITLAVYTGAILAGALAGGALPLVARVGRSDILLSFSAGVMLGAAFFHMLPEAVEDAGGRAIPFVLAGFLFLYLLERLVLVHVCAEPGPRLRAAIAPDGATAAPPLPGDAHLMHGHAPGEPHAHLHDGTGCDVHTMGIAAFVGMSLHTVVDGFALGAASTRPELGLLVFIAILAHKVPNSFSLSAILMAEGHSRAKALAMNAVFALMVPVGVAVYVVLRETGQVGTFPAFALAASAGTFLHLSLSDILPDLHRRGAPKWRLSASMLAGLAVMGALTFLRAH